VSLLQIVRMRLFRKEVAVALTSKVICPDCPVIIMQECVFSCQCHTSFSCKETTVAEPVNLISHLLLSDDTQVLVEIMLNCGFVGSTGREVANSSLWQKCQFRDFLVFFTISLKEVDESELG
jgi:hypothetical protein